MIIAIWKLTLLLASAPANSTPAMNENPIKINTGEANANLSGKLSGDQIIEYKLYAMAGQYLSLSLHSPASSIYFNITAPSAETAMFIGSTSGNTFSGELPSSGDYTIRIYMMRSAARQKKTARFTLNAILKDSLKTERSLSIIPIPTTSFKMDIPPL